MLPTILLIVGLVVLGFAGDALVRGAAAAAGCLHVPAVVVGLTIVAMATSAPELVVSVWAALNGAPGLAVGNVVGSNIANILLVLGLPAMITPVVLGGAGVRRATLILAAITALVAGLAANGVLDRFDGLLLLALLAGYLFYAGWALHGTAQPAAHAPAPAPTLRTVLLLAAGAAGLALGGALTVEGATGVAFRLGVSDTAIGLSLVAIGTSLPELSASIAAALRRESGIALGSVIGAGIFNLLGILGVTSILLPLRVPDEVVRFDLWVMLAAALALVPFVLRFRRIGRLVGAGMVLVYAAYLFVVLRGGVIA